MSSVNYHKGCSLVLCEIADIDNSIIIPIRYYLPDERLIANRELNDERKRGAAEHNHPPQRYAILPLDGKGNPLFPPGARM
jgi:hypothetical protein